MSHKIKLDFSKANQGGIHVPEGEYICKLINAVSKTSRQGTPQIELSFEIVSGVHKGDVLKSWYALTEAALYRFKKLLEDMRIEFDPDGEMDLDLDGMIDQASAVCLLVKEEPHYNDPKKLVKKVSDIYEATDAIVDQDGTDYTKNEIRQMDIHDLRFIIKHRELEIPSELDANDVSKMRDFVIEQVFEND